MISSTSRSRLYELRRDRLAAQRGADLVEQKRDVLVRETARRATHVGALRSNVHRSYLDARRLLRVADVDLGREGVASAALAQAMCCTVTSKSSTVMGVRLAEVHAADEPFRAMYGAASTSASLDAAALAFHELLPRLIELAAEQSALARLRMATRKATKIVNALRKVILPRLREQIRLSVESIAEEERDEAVRRRVRLAASKRMRR